MILNVFIVNSWPQKVKEEKTVRLSYLLILLVIDLAKENIRRTQPILSPPYTLLRTMCPLPWFQLHFILTTLQLVSPVQSTIQNIKSICSIACPAFVLPCPLVPQVWYTQNKKELSILLPNLFFSSYVSNLSK